MTSIIVGL